MIYQIFRPAFDTIADFLFDKLSRKTIFISDYDRFILVKGLSKDEIILITKEFGKLSGNIEYDFHQFEFAESEDWVIVKLDPKTDFFIYHNLISWYLAFDEKNNPAYSIGLAYHKTNSLEDYICFNDLEDEYREILVGSLRKDFRFRIKLTETDAEKTLLHRTFEFNLSFENVLKIISENGLVFSNLNEFKFSSSPIRINK